MGPIQKDNISLPTCSACLKVMFVATASAKTFFTKEKKCMLIYRNQLLIYNNNYITLALHLKEGSVGVSTFKLSVDLHPTFFIIATFARFNANFNK